jgi:hypothetical protein
VGKAKLADFRFHDLRHTAASYLAMDGASPSEIAAVLGHKTLAMVKRYAHLHDAHVADVMGRMAEKFLGGVKAGRSCAKDAPRNRGRSSSRSRSARRRPAARSRADPRPCPLGGAGGGKRHEPRRMTSITRMTASF